MVLLEYGHEGIAALFFLLILPTVRETKKFCLQYLIDN